MGLIVKSVLCLVLLLCGQVISGSEIKLSDLHTRSLVADNENTNNVEEEIVALNRPPPVSEMMVTQLINASQEISSKKCRDDVLLTLNGIQRSQRWALESK